MKFHKLVVIFILAALVISACGSAASSPTPQPTQPSVTQVAANPAATTQSPTAQPTPTATIPPNATRVNLWHSIPPATTKYWEEQLMPTFEKNHPECAIRTRQLGVEDPSVVFAGLRAGGPDAPDMVWIASSNTGAFVQAGVLADVQGYLDKNPDIKNNIIPSLLELSTYQGKVRSLPWMTNDTAFWINVDAFNKAGVPIPSQDPQKTWTWAEFSDAMKKVTTPDMAGYLVPVGGNVWDTWLYTAWIAAAGGTLLNPDGSAAFDSPEGIAAVKVNKDLVDGGYTTFSQLNKGYDAGPWYAGKVAVITDGPWNFPALSTFKDFKFTVVPWPRDKKAASNLGGDQLFIFNIHQNDKVTQCAFDYATYMLSDPFQIAFNIQSGNLPVTTSATQSKEYQAHLSEYPFLKGFVNSISVGVARPEIPNYSEVTNIFDSAWDGVMLKNEPITSTLKSAAQKVNSLSGQ
jgi:multiple sugar transport system substrate-binding protein